MEWRYSFVARISRYRLSNLRYLGHVSFSPWKAYFRLKDFLDIASVGGGGSRGISSSSEGSADLEMGGTGDDGGGSVETMISDAGDDIVALSPASLSRRIGSIV